VIRDLNPYFWINADPDVCRIAPKMFWIHCLVGISHFAKFRKNRRVTMRNGNRSPKILYSAMVKKMEE